MDLISQNLTTIETDFLITYLLLLEATPKEIQNGLFGQEPRVLTVGAQDPWLQANIIRHQFTMILL